VGCAFGTLAHADSARQIKTTLWSAVLIESWGAAARRDYPKRHSALAPHPGSTHLHHATRTGMIWFLIEAGVALLLLILIVWWTVPRRKGGKDRDGPQSGA
jgi:hypothetical protein